MAPRRGARRDLLLQLSLNPAFGRNELLRIRDAIEMQVAPAGISIFMASRRLAADYLHGAARADHGRRMDGVVRALSNGGDEIFASQTGLARRHDVNAFLQVIWLNARLSEECSG